MSEVASTYTVKPGDSLSKIANQHQTTTQDLAKANQIKNPQLITPGQTLIIPTADVPNVEFQFLDKFGNPIVDMTCFITYCGTETIVKTDSNGKIPAVSTKKSDDEIKIAVKKLDGGKKHVGTVRSSSQPKFVQVKSPAVKLQVTTQQHQGAPGAAKIGRPKESGPASGVLAVRVDRNEAGHPVAVAVAGAILEKSGDQWCGRFLQGEEIDDLRQPFRGKFQLFYDALKAGGVKVKINTTYRPPQRSYLMYYAAEIKNGKLSPDKVPVFIPQKGDSPVNIDWAHRSTDGKADLDAAKKAAEKMFARFNAGGAIGKPYSSNHNIGAAVDMKLIPSWGIGKSIKTNGDKDSKIVEVKNKKDIMAVGATYGVFHWDFHGRKRKKTDDVHWSSTGN